MADCAYEVDHCRIGDVYPPGELPRYWTPEQIRQILAALPAGQPWLFAVLTG